MIPITTETALAVSVVFVAIRSETTPLGGQPICPAAPNPAKTNGNFVVFVYSYVKKQKHTHKNAKNTDFALLKPPKAGVWGRIGVLISAGCTKFSPSGKNPKFITIYVKKWYF